MCPIVVGPSGEQFEVEPGGGDLSTTSTPFEVADSFSFGSAFYGGRPISYARMFVEQPWVATAVMRMLTWAIRVPLKTYRILDADGAKQQLSPADGGIARAMSFPWARASQADLVLALLGPDRVHGNALMLVEDGAADQLRFKPLDWRMVIPFRDDIADPWSDVLAWDVFKPSSGYARYSADQVMHLKTWSPLGNLGVSPLQQLRSSLASETAAVEWGVNNLRQSWRPDGLVELSDTAMQLKPDDRFTLYNRAKKELRETYAGQTNAGKLPVLPPGLKWTDAHRTTAVEAALIDQRLINRGEVASVYQIPPPMIGQLEHVRAMTGLQTLREMAYTDSLGPPLVMIEQLINAFVIQGLLRQDDIFVEFDLGAILRGDRLSEIKALREAVGMGIYTPNEARGYLNLPKSEVDSADDLWLPTNNLTPIGQVNPQEDNTGDA